MPEIFKTPVPYFTQEVVEKFMDFFGNQKGEIKGNKIYQRNGWGSILDFRMTLEKAGWFTDRTINIKGHITKEKHTSSTISFEMPPVEGVKSLYIKFHDDHKSGDDMRPIAGHFILKMLEKFNFIEEFWYAYYETHFVKK